MFKENLENQKKFNFSYANNNENDLSNEIELTSYVLIALNQFETEQNDKKTKIDFVKKKSLKYLNSMLEIVNGQDNLLTLSILTYALNLFKTDKADLAYQYLGGRLQKKDRFYFWSKEGKIDKNEKLDPRNLIENSRNLQATSYGLLTQILCNGFIKKEIVNWLNSNLQMNGFYLPIYDTILATEAILTYLIHSDSNLDSTYFNVEIENYKENIKLNLDLKNDDLLSMNSSIVKNNKDSWLMKASGDGFGILQIKLNYALSWNNFITNQMQIQNDLVEQLFSVRVNYYLSGTNYSNLKLEICLKNEFKLKNRPVLLKFRLPTSFHISPNQLNSMVQDRILSNLKEATFLTEDTVIFIFDKVI